MSKKQDKILELQDNLWRGLKELARGADPKELQPELDQIERELAKLTKVNNPALTDGA